MKRFIILAIATIVATATAITPLSAQSTLRASERDSVTAVLRRITLDEVAGSYVKVESARIKSRGKSQSIEIRTSAEMAYYPMRPESVEQIYSAVRKALPAKYRGYTLLIYTGGRLIDDLIPQYYRSREGQRSFTHIVETPLITR